MKGIFFFDWFDRGPIEIIIYIYRDICFYLKLGKWLKYGYQRRKVDFWSIKGMIPSKILSYVFGSVKNPVHVLKVNSTEASLTWEDSKPEHVHRYRTPFAPERKSSLIWKGHWHHRPQTHEKWTTWGWLNPRVCPVIHPLGFQQNDPAPPGWGMSLCGGRDRRGTTQIRWLWRNEKGKLQKNFSKIGCLFSFWSS